MYDSFETLIGVAVGLWLAAALIWLHKHTGGGSCG